MVVLCAMFGVLLQVPRFRNLGNLSRDDSICVPAVFGGTAVSDKTFG